MSYSKEREEFVYRMARIGWRLDAIQAILRDAGIVQRAAEIDCSVSDPLVRANAEKASQAAETRMHRRCEPESVFCHGDPRGYCVTVSLRNPENGDIMEIGVPAQGYRASQIERMGAR